MPACAQRIAHDAVGILGQFVGRDKVVGLVEIERRDLAGVDELDQFERLLGLELDRVDILGIDQQVLSFSYS